MTLAWFSHPFALAIHTHAHTHTHTHTTHTCQWCYFLGSKIAELKLECSGKWRNLKRRWFWFVFCGCIHVAQIMPTTCKRHANKFWPTQYEIHGELEGRAGEQVQQQAHNKRTQHKSAQHPYKQTCVELPKQPHEKGAQGTAHRTCIWMLQMHCYLTHTRMHAHTLVGRCLVWKWSGMGHTDLRDVQYGKIRIIYAIRL